MTFQLVGIIEESSAEFLNLTLMDYFLYDTKQIFLIQYKNNE